MLAAGPAGLQEPSASTASHQRCTGPPARPPTTPHPSMLPLTSEPRLAGLTPPTESLACACLAARPVPPHLSPLARRASILERRSERTSAPSFRYQLLPHDRAPVSRTLVICTVGSLPLVGCGSARDARPVPVSPTLAQFGSGNDEERAVALSQTRAAVARVAIPKFAVMRGRSDTAPLSWVAADVSPAAAPVIAITNVRSLDVLGSVAPAPDCSHAPGPALIS